LSVRVKAIDMGDRQPDGRPAPAPSRRRAHSQGSHDASRRAFLGLCAGGVAALAGCSGPAANADGAVPSATGTAAGPPDFPALYRESVDSVALVGTASGQGSAWVFDDAGRIVTNQHVVGDADRVDVRYDTDVWRTGDVLGTDAIGDLAVVEPASPPDFATPLSLTTATPPVGSDVAIIGSPLGLPGSLSVGVVSATNRSLDSPTGSSIPGAIQVDATANPGNSGGPIPSAGGTVVGVLVAGAGVAVNFGIPGRLVERVVPALVEDGAYRYPTLGASTLEVDPAIARANDLDAVTGVMVTAVTEDAPADGRLREPTGATTVEGRTLPVGGDVVVGLDDRTVTSEADYASYLTFSTAPGDDVAVTVLRDGSRRTVDLTVGGRSRP
jgi:S1-C subfamily serine protease